MVGTPAAFAPASDRVTHKKKPTPFLSEKLVKAVAGDNDVKQAMAQVVDICEVFPFTSCARPFRDRDAVSSQNLAVRFSRVLVIWNDPGHVEVIPLAYVSYG